MAALMSPGEIVSASFSRAQEMANDALYAYERNAQLAGVAAGATIDVDPPKLEPIEVPEEFKAMPDIAEVDIPRKADGADIETFEELSDKTIDKLTTLFKNYIVEFFPNECDSLKKAQQWVCDTLTKGGTGIHPDVEDQIWQRDRARVLQDVKRAGDEVIATFAARGFPLPPGAAAHQLALVQQDGQNKISQASRDVAIKQAEIEIENVRFAVERAIALYQTAMSAAMEYVKALAIGPQLAAQVLPSITDSQSRLISAASDYYRAQLQAREILLSYEKARADVSLRGVELQVGLNDKAIQRKVDALLSISKDVSQQVSSLLNALHVSTSTSASASNSVGYSYGGDVSGEAPVKTTT